MLLSASRSEIWIATIISMLVRMSSTGPHTVSHLFVGKVDRWQIVEHVPPGYSVSFAGCLDAGTGAPSGIRRGRPVAPARRDQGSRRRMGRIALIQPRDPGRASGRV